MSKVLVKLTNHDNKAIYIDVDKIVTIEECSSNYNAASIPSEYMNTLISLGNAAIPVKEHMLEVIALIQGINPKPAKILFGKKE